ncbi:hypothetical protein [Alloactinosynnema sp. L-07]|nr:hypothetical protein [Alloactinosynnema sp. L-07]
MPRRAFRRGTGLSWWAVSKPGPGVRRGVVAGSPPRKKEIP